MYGSIRGRGQAAKETTISGTNRVFVYCCVYDRMHLESSGAGIHLSSWRLPSERMEHSRLYHRRYWVGEHGPLAHEHPRVRREGVASLSSASTTATGIRRAKLTSRAERYPSGNDTSVAHCVASPICNFDLCYHRVRAILWEATLHLVCSLLFESNRIRQCKGVVCSVDPATGQLAQKDPTPCGTVGSAFKCEPSDALTGMGVKWECSSNTSWPGPNNGITNFDNFGLAMLTVFQCVSLEGWTDVMYWVGKRRCWTRVALDLLRDARDPRLVLRAESRFGCAFRRIFQGARESSRSWPVPEISRETATGGRSERKIFYFLCLIGYLDWITQAEDIDPVNDEQEEEPQATATGEEVDEEGEERAEEARPSNSSHQLSFCFRFEKTNRRCRRACRRLVKSQTFYWLVILLVLLNTLVLTSEHYGQSEWLDDFQTMANLFFVILFSLEMLLKMYSLGFTTYTTSQFNRFDCFVVISSIIEFVLLYLRLMKPLGVSVLRSARLLRIFKVTKYWTSLRNLVSSLLNSLRSIMSLLLLLFLFIVIFALLGMQVFGGKFNFNPQQPKPRANFDTFIQSLLTVFQILTGEDWNTVMYNGIESFGGVGTLGVIVSIYYIVLFICGG
ncbi:transporter, cation channel family protein [Ancylostoma duodenale]|uniref:Transporter, cation channel family protein n=1 Tax=Ancylostoma duodenale TaxID=51022 RepID=A0A0C2CPY7_9BILA|nr:transporter, cation channel family protein [Ancylostoma duodenale]